MMEKFTITRVVTKNIVTDSFQGLRNLFEMRLRGYEKMIDISTKDLIKKMESDFIHVSWWKMSINPLTTGSVMITLYGEGERR